MDAKKLMQLIRSGKPGRDEALGIMYNDEKLRQNIKSMLRNKGAKKEDFEDVFVDTLLQFVKTVMKRRDLEIENIYQYITGVANYVWLAKIRKVKKNRTENLDDIVEPQTDFTPESLMFRKDKIDLLAKLLDGLGKNCKEVLLLWAHGYSMIEIAEKMGYKSAGMAKKKKYQCMRDLLGGLDGNAGVVEILL